MARALPPLSGLSFGRGITQGNVSFDMTFSPSVGIMARRVDKLGLDIRSFREPLTRSVREVMIPSIQQNFTSGGRPKWTPLDEGTLRQKTGGSILVRTGALKQQMGALKIWDIDRDRALIANLPEAVAYGGIHQAGASFSTRESVSQGPALTYRGKSLGQKREQSTGTIPARPFVMIQKQDEVRIVSIFRHWLDERIRKAGL